MVKPSGNGIHVPLHADGVGAVQLDVQRTGVVQYLLRLAGTAQNGAAPGSCGRHGNDQLRHGAVVLSVRSSHFASSSSAVPAGGLEAGVRVAGAASG